MRHWKYIFTAALVVTVLASANVGLCDTTAEWSGPQQTGTLTYNGIIVTGSTVYATMIGDVTGDLTGDDITASGAYSASLDINMPAAVTNTLGTVNIKSPVAGASVADDDFVKINLLNAYNESTSAVNYAYMKVAIDDATGANEDGSIILGVEVASTATDMLTIDAAGATVAGPVVATEATIDGKYGATGPDASNGILIQYGTFTNGQAAVTFGTPFLPGTTPVVTANWTMDISAVDITNAAIDCTAIATNQFVPKSALDVATVSNANYIAVGIRP